MNGNVDERAKMDEGLAGYSRWKQRKCIKGTVADIWPLVLIMNRPMWAPNSYPKTFSNSRRYSNFKVVLLGYQTPQNTKKFLDRGLFKPALGSVVYTSRRFSKSVPLKRMASSQNFFVWFCGVLICQGGLIPYRARSCRV